MITMKSEQFSNFRGKANQLGVTPDFYGGGGGVGWGQGWNPGGHCIVIPATNVVYSCCIPSRWSRVRY